MTHCSCKRQQCSGQSKVVQVATTSDYLLRKYNIHTPNLLLHTLNLLLHTLWGPGSAGFPYPVRHELESLPTHQVSRSTTKIWNFFNAFRFIENDQKVETWVRTWLTRQLVEEHGFKKKNMPSLSKNETLQTARSCNSVFKNQSRLINWWILIYECNLHLALATAWFKLV